MIELRKVSCAMPTVDRQATLLFEDKPSSHAKCTKDNKTRYGVDTAPWKRKLPTTTTSSITRII